MTIAQIYFVATACHASHREPTQRQTGSGFAFTTHNRVGLRFGLLGW